MFALRRAGGCRAKALASAPPDSSGKNVGEQVLIKDRVCANLRKYKRLRREDSDSDMDSESRRIEFNSIFKRQSKEKWPGQARFSAQI